jgi:hypothetical protein
MLAIFISSETTSSVAGFLVSVLQEITSITIAKKYSAFFISGMF